jgi:hypothetical protein
MATASSEDEMRDINGSDGDNSNGSVNEIIIAKQIDVETRSAQATAAPSENLVRMASIEEVLAWMDNFAKLKSRVIMQNPAYYTKLAIRGKERVLINRS